MKSGRERALASSPESAIAPGSARILQVFLGNRHQLAAPDFRRMATKIPQRQRVKRLDRVLPRIAAQRRQRRGAQLGNARTGLDLHKQRHSCVDQPQDFLKGGNAPAVGQGDCLQARKRQFVYALFAAANAPERVVVKDDQLFIGRKAHVQFDAHACLHRAAKGLQAVFRGAAAVQAAMGVQARKGRFAGAQARRAEEQIRRQDKRRPGQHPQPGHLTPPPRCARAANRVWRGGCRRGGQRAW